MVTVTVTQHSTHTQDRQELQSDQFSWSSAVTCVVTSVCTAVVISGSHADQSAGTSTGPLQVL